MNNFPIYLIDDDIDDYDFLLTCIQEIGLTNPIKHFKNGKDFLDHLKQSSEIPFIILCDVNVRPMDGFQIRKLVTNDPSINFKSVPFIFWSNLVSEEQTQKAYEMMVHGFFVKGNSHTEMKKFIKVIIDYWMLSKVPSLRMNL